MLRLQQNENESNMEECCPGSAAKSSNYEITACPQTCYQPHRSKIPLRAFVNILLIFLLSAEVTLIMGSQIYLRGDLIHSFLSAYADRTLYDSLFTGESYGVDITDVSQLQKQLSYIFSSINSANDSSFLRIDYSQTIITLNVEYDRLWLTKQLPTVYVLDPEIGIVEPFDMNNFTSIQMFLLKTASFNIALENVTIVSPEFIKRYKHTVLYECNNQAYVHIRFDFEIDNVLMQSLLEGNYIVTLRIFYAFIILTALVSLYLNMLYLKRSLKEHYARMSPAVAKKQATVKRMLDSLRKDSSIRDSKDEIKRIEGICLQSRLLADSDQDQELNATVGFDQYLGLLPADLIFSVISNILAVFGTFLLLSGKEQSGIVGLSCMFAWLSIFRIVKHKPRVYMMYELIKMSIGKVFYFFGSFAIIFMAYALLGMNLFPKSRFFFTLMFSITTLVSLMLGDSIQLITSTICEQYSTTAAALYTFSYVILFMHAIHNTLTSLIKEYFIMQKIKLIESEKEKQGHCHFVYIQEVPSTTEKQNSELPLKATPEFQREMFTCEKKAPVKHFRKHISMAIQQFEKILLHQKWQLYDLQMHKSREYCAELKKRLAKIFRNYSGME